MPRCNCLGIADFDIVHAPNSPMCDVIKLIKQVAPTSATVLITGETGTGKELVARAIHSLSQRANLKFYSLNLAEVQPTLIESELFGHRKGAFTSATYDREGLFEAAKWSTLFLDEIGDVPPDIQAKLLSAVENGKVRRMGENQFREVSVRIIAATNKDLEKAMSKGEFREDLYYRLNVFKIQLPPLRERREDVCVLAEYFLEKFAHQHDRNCLQLTDEVKDLLKGYRWPGNVRTLRNLMECATILGDLDRVVESWVSAEATGGLPTKAGAAVPATGGIGVNSHAEVLVVDDYDRNRERYKSFFNKVENKQWLAERIGVSAVGLRVEVVAPSDLPSDQESLQDRLRECVLMISDIDFSQDDRHVWQNGAELLACVSNWCPWLRRRLVFVSRHGDRFQSMEQFYREAKSALRNRFNSEEVAQLLSRVPAAVVHIPSELPIPEDGPHWRELLAVVNHVLAEAENEKVLFEQASSMSSGMAADRSRSNGSPASTLGQGPEKERSDTDAVSIGGWVAGDVDKVSAQGAMLGSQPPSVSGQSSIPSRVLAEAILGELPKTGCKLEQLKCAFEAVYITHRGMVQNLFQNNQLVSNFKQRLAQWLKSMKVQDRAGKPATKAAIRQSIHRNSNTWRKWCSQ